MALETETDGFRVDGREIYWWRRKKRGTSLFSTVTLGKGTPRALYDSELEHDHEADREMAVA
jgi:hypothetical protein